MFYFNFRNAEGREADVWAARTLREKFGSDAHLEARRRASLATIGSRSRAHWKRIARLLRAGDV